MKLIPAAGAILGIVGGWLSLQSSGEHIIILSGDTQGYLSPCGCTAPMIGGIRRRGSAIRNLVAPGSTTILENGGFVTGSSRQDQMKAETIVQAMAELGVTAINMGPSDARLGRGMLLQLSQLSESRLTSLSVKAPEDLALTSSVANGPFLVGGATDAPRELAGPLSAEPVALEAAVGGLVDEARAANLKPILMLQGSKGAAVRLAKAFPSLALIQYSSGGSPALALETVGSTGLASTGEHGKFVVRLSYRDGQFSGYRAVALGPALRDDPVTSRLYATYLRRVKAEKLLEKLPRVATPSFAGSWACTPCHTAATRIWKKSLHRHALETLEKAGHDRDPDCVSCHVVGLSSTKGFRSRNFTPALADVGCESCHGPALAHVARPRAVRLSKIGSKECVGCHNPQNSPNFEFDAYWRKIVHR
jgi:hypothetical protein